MFTLTWFELGSAIGIGAIVGYCFAHIEMWIKRKQGDKE